jgi:hypothetical protein
MSADYPLVVNVLAKQIGLTPISWFVASDHVEIVFEGGKKYRFALPIAPAAALAAAPSAPKPKPNQGVVTRTRARAKK